MAIEPDNMPAKSFINDSAMFAAIPKAETRSGSFVFPISFPPFARSARKRL
jgi:hypothetical protein